MAKRVVIVGGGVAGIYVLRNLLVRKDEVEEGLNFTLIKREKSGWESTCGLPFALRGWYEIDRTEINKPQFFIDQGVDFRTETEVTRLNVEENSVVLKTGEVLKYDYLAIATGREPSVPAVVKEAKLEGVYTFTDEDDARKIEAAMNSADVKNAFVRGRGFIGLQAAVAFSEKGLKTAVLGGPLSLLPSCLDPDMGDMVKEWLEKQGIRFILERKEITGLKGDGGRVKSVVISDGGEEEEIPADVVVIAKGMNPNTQLAKDAGIETGESRGIVTDSVMRVKKGRGYLSNVYAVGDCTEVIDGVTHRPRLSQFASTAVVQAKVITDNILSDVTGQPAVYSSYEPCLSPSVTDIGGLLVGSVGVTSEVAARAGIKTICGQATKLTKARYFPGAKPLTLKLIFDAYTRKLIGAQMAGEATVAERVNEFAVAIRVGMTAEEMRNMERCFDPSLALLIDVVINAAEKALGITPVT
ncbi:MAG: FAD-dependent oxidoreductase [Halobacteriota archaeon]